MVDLGFTDPSYTEAMVEVVHLKWAHISYWLQVLLCHMLAQNISCKADVGTALVTLEKPLNFWQSLIMTLYLSHYFYVLPNKDEHIQLLTGYCHFI